MHSRAGDRLLNNAMIGEEPFPASHGAFHWNYVSSWKRSKEYDHSPDINNKMCAREEY